MQYVSTRGVAPVLEFDEVLLTGMALDGGLYLPNLWPQFSLNDIRSMRNMTYSEIVVKVMTPFLGNRINNGDFASMASETYAKFTHTAVAPLKQLDANLWLMELFHGPTLAFKDYPLQLIGRLFDYVLSGREERVTIVGATSGDTGSAAIEACRDCQFVEIFILFPNGRVSDVQRRQMTTVASNNVHCIAVDGTFDDCQDLVKAMFADESFRLTAKLSAVNSINWARVAAQMVYYFHAAVCMGAPDRSVSFAVPTGNFGNVFAAYAAKACGLTIEQIIIGTNSNDILTRFFKTGKLSISPVYQTISPSMDIQVSSNFERFLFDLFDGDSVSLNSAMTAFRRDGTLSVDKKLLHSVCEKILAGSLTDMETINEMKRTLEITGELIDPHTAIGISVGRSFQKEGGTPMIAQAAAHPVKFRDVVEAATGLRPVLPPHLRDLDERSEYFEVLPNDLTVIQNYIRMHLRLGGVA